MQVRAATAADYETYARLVPELGVDGPLPASARFVAEVVPRALVAVDGDAAVGYAVFDLLDDTAYVRNVVTDPAHRRRGIGAALMTAIRVRARTAGARSWCLNVRPSNLPALALYHRCGLDLAYRSIVTRLPPDAVVPPADAAIVLVEADPPTAAALEAQFGLPPGQLAAAQTRADRTVLQLRRGDASLGLGVLVHAVHGAFPFRLVDLALLPTFVARLRARLAPDAPYLQLTADGDDALAAALHDLGARVHLELAHLRGALA